MDKEDFEIRFTYHPPQSDEIVDAFVKIRETALYYAEMMNLFCKDCRELSLAITKLEEAVFWANAALARNGLRKKSKDGPY